MILSNFLKNKLKRRTARWTIFILIILGSTYFALYNYITPKADWFVCLHDNECTSNAVCNTHAINKKYVTRATSFNNLFEPTFRTQCWVREFGPPRQSFCKKNICEDFDNTTEEDWIKCEKNSDCVEIYANCGHKMAVSKRFQSAAKSFFKKISSDSFDICEEVPKGDFHILCENSQCKGEYR